ncbi:MAG: GNAT family N-acetyltransferase [bacterium]|nr:GNAT family N-acetyltransferase [bacterium]
MPDLNLPTLETGRVLLRTLNPGHFKKLIARFDDSTLCAALGLPNEEVYKGIKERYITFGLDNERLGMHNWLLYRKDTGKFIGDFSYHIICKRHRRGEIGYGLFETEDRGQGFMQELLPLTLRFGFEELGLERIEALTAVDNWASMSLLRKFGFRREGYARRHYRWQGKNTDSFSFSLLPEDFKPEPVLTPIEKLVRGFERQAIPEEGWTHEAHLKVALWYLYHNGEDEALCRMRNGIIAYNLYLGHQNTPEAGYHETLTVFWIAVLKQFLEAHSHLNYEEASRAFLQAPQSASGYPKAFYSEKLLESVRARSRWVAPDLRPL